MSIERRPTLRVSDPPFVRNLKQSINQLYDMVAKNRIIGDGCTFRVTDEAGYRVGHATASEASVNDYPGRVYLDGGNINVTRIPLNFWTGTGWDSTTKAETGSSSWGTLAGEYVYIRLELSSGSPVWSLAHKVGNPLADDDQDTRSWILAQVGAGGVPTQHHMGAIYETMGG